MNVPTLAQKIDTIVNRFPSATQQSSTKLTYKIIDVASNTFCYDIYSNGKLLIHQTNIPGLNGNEGFKTKEGAKRVAEFVISKLKKGEIPPTVSIVELKKLKAIR